MLLCVREELSIYHFTSKLEISKNTFLTDLKKLEQRLEEYHLEVLYSRQEGYHLVGSEYAKREMMVTSIRGILKIPRGKETIMDICQISEEMMEQVENRFQWLRNVCKFVLQMRDWKNFLWSCVWSLSEHRREGFFGSFQRHFNILPVQKSILWCLSLQKNTELPGRQKNYFWQLRFRFLISIHCRQEILHRKKNWWELQKKWSLILRIWSV